MHPLFGSLLVRSWPEWLLRCWELQTPGLTPGHCLTTEGYFLVRTPEKYPPSYSALCWMLDVERSNTGIIYQPSGIIIEHRVHKHKLFEASYPSSHGACSVCLLPLLKKRNTWKSSGSPLVVFILYTSLLHLADFAWC